MIIVILKMTKLGRMVYSSLNNAQIVVVLMSVGSISLVVFLIIERREKSH